MNLNEMKIKIKKKNKDKNHIIDSDNLDENLNINNEYKAKELNDNKNKTNKEEINKIKEDNDKINNIYNIDSNIEISIKNKTKPKNVQKNEINDNPNINESSTNMKNKQMKFKKKSKEKNWNLIICRNVIDFIVFGEKENYNNKKAFESKKSNDKISNKYKKLLSHRNTKSISNQNNNRLLLELSEEKKNINKETVIKFKTSNNFYKREKDLLRKQRTHSEDKSKKNITYINNNIDMFNFNFSNNKNNRNYNYPSLNKENPVYQKQNKINFKIDEENNIEEESNSNSDKTNNLFSSNNLINFSTPTKYRINSKKRAEIKKYKYGTLTNINGYYEKRNFNNLNEYIKEIQLRNQNKANRRKVKANRIVKKDFYTEKRKMEFQNKNYNTLQNFYRAKKMESPEYNNNINNLTKTNKKTLISLKKYNKYLSPRQLDTYNVQMYYTPEKNGTADDIKIENNKLSERNKKENKNKNNIEVKSYQNKNKNHSFLPNIKIEPKSRTKKRYSKRKEDNKDEGSGKKYHMINKNKKYDKDDNSENSNFLFNSISNFKKFDNNIVEDYKNRLKLKLISLTDDLKDENEEEKLKYYIGPIDLSLISIKGNLKESIEDLKDKFSMNGYECLDNDNKNEIKSQIKYIKNGIIYIAEIVKIKNNLLYYLITNQKNNK